MAIRVFGGVAGSRAFRNIWMLEELGIAYENIPLDFRSAARHEPNYLALNPNGRVPTLTDGDLVLWESLAINLYLAKVYGGTLQPASLAAEAHALKWSFWAVSELDAPQDAALRHGSTIPAAQLLRGYQILDSALRDTVYLLGEQFTVADLNVVAVAARPSFPPVSTESLPAFSRWQQSCLARPACLRALNIVGARLQNATRSS